MIQRHSIFWADEFWNFECIKSYSDKSPMQLSSKANSFDKKKKSFHIKSKRTLNDRPACSIVSVSVWYTSWESTRPVLCVFIRWRKSGRNNNGSSNQQQCLLFVRLHTQSVPSEAVIVNLWWQKETLCVRRFHTLCIRVRARVRAQCFCNFINWISFTTWDFAKWHTFAIQEPRGQSVNKKESEGEWLGGTSKRILSFSCEKKKLKVVLNVSYGKKCYHF